MINHQFAKSDYNLLPSDPGVYKFFNKQGIIIYVGKAKHLKKRVASYFSKQSQLNRKTVRLVSEVSTIEVTVVDSEFDALLLENNLIKENQPKYNILLKDDKSFPYLVVTNERFPRIFSTRKVDKNLGKYFGPYTSVKAMNSVLELLRKLYHIRTCSFNLSEGNIEKKKFKICLEYHLGNCLGPCEGKQSEASYLSEITHAQQILKGRTSLVTHEYKEKMKEHAENLQFEQAQSIKTKSDLLDKFQTKSLVVNQSITNLDIVGCISNDGTYFVNYMIVVAGTIKASETVLVKSRLNEDVKEIMEYIIPILQDKYQSINNQVLSNVMFELENSQITIPQIGDKKKLVDLSLKNALLFKKSQLDAALQTKDRSFRVLNQLKDDLRLQTLPLHIECFDNSNLQGTNPVASMVCFKNGKPSKKEYRHYNIKTVVGPDDFSSMKEIVFRRYKRLSEEKKTLPDLIVVDGGKGQLSSACEALKTLELYGSVPIIGIAKRLEELYFPGDQIPIYVSKKSESLKLLQFMRDEAHRFAITFHRNKRSSKSNNSILDEISGIGPSTKKKLLIEYKSAKKISQLSIDALSTTIGKRKAILVYKFFGKKKGDQ